MIKLLLFTILVCFVSIAHSQGLTISLSISYKKQVDTIFSKGDSINNPYLNIHYQNNKPFPIYFLKTNNRNGLPKFPFGLNCTTLNQDQLAMIVQDFTDSTFYISISNQPHKGRFWEAVISEVETFSREIEGINDDFQYMYDYIRRKKFPKPKPEKYYYEAKEFTPNNIYNKTSNDFMFLKASETKTDTFDLIALYRTGGIFTFKYNSNFIFEYVFTEALNKTCTKITSQKLFLPKMVNGYNLFSGKFDFNGVKVAFKGIKHMKK